MAIRISVIISAYNAEDCIASAIESALKQNYPKDKYEVIVVDDGSTDNTLYKTRHYKDSITVISKPNTGLADSVNMGIKNSKGKYIIRLDADDTFEPDILAKEVELSEKEGYAALGCYRREINKKNSSSKIVEIDDVNIFKWIAAGILFKKDALIKSGLYKQLLFEEYDVLLRIVQFGKIGVIKLPLYNYYLHDKNITAKDSYWKDGIKEFMSIWDNSSLERYGFYKEFAHILGEINASKDKR